MLKFCIVLYYSPLGEKHVDGHGPIRLLLDYYPEISTIAWINQLLKVKLLCVAVGWFVYSFIYFFWIHPCTEVLRDALNREFHKACHLCHIVHQEPFAGNCARSLDCWPSGVALASES